MSGLELEKAPAREVNTDLRMFRVPGKERSTAERLWRRRCSPCPAQCNFYRDYAVVHHLFLKASRTRSSLRWNARRRGGEQCAEEQQTPQDFRRRRPPPSVMGRGTDPGPTWKLTRGQLPSAARKNPALSRIPRPGSEVTDASRGLIQAE